MIKFHFNNAQNPMKVALLLEELELPRRNMFPQNERLAG